MSGTLEAVASAFAVVGVADVLVRTGRDLYSFLGDVLDAPEEIDRLREIIRATVILYHNSIRCRAELKPGGITNSTATATALLESATKALNRELQGLKIIAKRYNGVKTWRNFKYALGKEKTVKVIRNLENAKSLLASALSFACMEVSARDHAHLEDQIRQSFHGAELQANDLSRALAAKVDAQHQNTLALNKDHHRSLRLEINDNRTQLLSNQDKQHQALVIMHQKQSDIVDCQVASTRVMTRISKQTSCVQRTMHHAHAKASESSNKITTSLDKLETDVKQILYNSCSSSSVNQSRRDIFFLGENQDKIVARLLYLEQDVYGAIDHLISRHGSCILVRHAEWLRSEYRHLVGSAAQEQALRYPNSTARPFDRWFYHEDTVGLRNNTRDFTTPSSRDATTPISSKTCASNKEDSQRQVGWPKTRRNQSNRLYSIPTSSGYMQISMPATKYSSEDSQSSQEVGFSVNVVQNGSTVQVHARFLRYLTSAFQPRIYAQLNVSTVIVKNSEIHSNLFRIGSLAEIDIAIRDGTISPFHVDIYGDNVCSYWATAHRRQDVLRYLDGQGFGKIVLKHDTRIAQVYSAKRMSYYRDELLNEDVPSRAANPTEFVLHVALAVMLTSLHAIMDVTTIFNISQNFLQEFEVLPVDTNWSSLPYPELLQVLIEIGSPIEKTLDGLNAISLYMRFHYRSSHDVPTTIRALSILIEAGIDINYACFEACTPSMYARYQNVWFEWGQALEHNGKRIDDVLDMEGTSWMLEDNWRDVWKERQYPHWENP